MLSTGEAYYSWRDLERSFAGDGYELAVSRIYGAWDREMLDKLLKIAKEHDLLLHTEKYTEPEGGVLGFEAFIYENGAVRRDCTGYIDGEPVLLHFYYEPYGTLPAESLTPYGTDEFEQWDYTTARGANISIALR